MLKRPPVNNKSFEDLIERIRNADLNFYFIFGAILLVFIVGTYALFSPESRNARLGNPACGKIVIATDGPSLASNVSASLSDARYFLVINPLSKKLLEAIPNPYRGAQPNPQIAYLIAGKGEEAVIVGNVDKQSYDILMQFGIRVFGGYQGPARKSISLYRQARIEPSAQPSTGAVSPTTEFAQTPQQEVMPQTAGQQVTWGMNSQTCPIPGPVQVNAGQGAMGAGFGMQNMTGLGLAQPNCPLPGSMQANTIQGSSMPGFGVPDIMMQGGGMGAGFGAQNLYNNGGFGGMNMNANFGLGNQAAAGWGQQQSFVCPNCNWRMNALRQGNSYPNCPNCAAAMALDMAQGNNSQLAAQGMQPQMNQLQNQSNFGQGQNSLGYFLCPNCNWRVYSQPGSNQFPKCPNCGQIMANSGAYTQNQNMVNNNASPGFLGNNNFASQVAFSPNSNNYYNQGNSTTAIIPAANAGTTSQVPSTGLAALAPPIFRDAIMPHEYRGVCENCHVIRADIPIPANALMPHPYRGVCSNCHQILGTAAGVQNNQQPTPVTTPVNNTIVPNQNTAHVTIGGVK